MGKRGSGYLASAFLMSCSTMGGGPQPTLTAEGKLDPPIIKYADFKARPYCQDCRVDFETDAPPEMPAGALSLEIVRLESEGVLHIALRMHRVPDRLLSVKGTLEVARENGMEGSGLPVRYRDYYPGDVFPLASGKPPCYDVNGKLTSLIRFVGTNCSLEDSASSRRQRREDGVLLTLSFDLVGAGDVRFRTTELVANVGDAAALRTVILYGGILHVRREI